MFSCLKHRSQWSWFASTLSSLKGGCLENVQSLSFNLISYICSTSSSKNISTLKEYCQYNTWACIWATDRSEPLLCSQWRDKEKKDERLFRSMDRNISDLFTSEIVIDRSQAQPKIVDFTYDNVQYLCRCQPIYLLDSAFVLRNFICLLVI